jgi:hypothetical protein
MKNDYRQEILVREAVRSVILESMMSDGIDINETSSLGDIDSLIEGFSALKDFFTGKLEQVANAIKEKLEKIKSDLSSNFKDRMEVAKEIIEALKSASVNVPANNAFNAIKQLHELGPKLDSAISEDGAPGGAAEDQIEKIASSGEKEQAKTVESLRRKLHSMNESLSRIDENLRVQKALEMINEAAELVAVGLAILGWWMGLLALVSGLYFISKGIYWLCKKFCGPDATSTKVAHSFEEAFHTVEMGLKDITVPDPVSFAVYKSIRKIPKIDMPDHSYTEYVSSKEREATEKWLFFAILIFSLWEAIMHLAHASGWLMKIIFGGKSAVKGVETGIGTYEIGATVAGVVKNASSTAAATVEAEAAASLASAAIGLTAAA